MRRPGPETGAGGAAWLRRLVPVSIRARLTVWYALALALFMAGTSAASYALLARATLRRVDQSLLETAHTFAAAWNARRAMTLGDPAPSADVAARFAAGELEVAVFDEARRVVAARPPALAWADGAAPNHRDLLALLRQLSAADVARATLVVDGAPRRALAVPLRVGGRRQVVVVAQGLGGRKAMLRDAAESYAVALPVTLALALAGGYFLAARALAPVSTLANQAARIGASTLDERLAVPNERDELGRLARAFNDLLGRLDRAFEQQRRFMADAAHELRTPVAVVRTEADVSLDAAERPAAEYRDALVVIRDESRRMSHIIDDLLLLARADAGQYPLKVADFYLDDLIEECVRAVRALASARGVSVRYSAPSEEMPARGDEALLRRLVLNLLDNAIKYGPAGGTVTVRASRAVGASPAYVVTVHDEGAAIAPEVRERLFDRFFRGPGESTDGTPHGGGGAGLGLSISRWIADAHAATLELARSDASGTEFRLVLPASPPRPDASARGATGP